MANEVFFISPKIKDTQIKFGVPMIAFKDAAPQQRKYYDRIIVDKYGNMLKRIKADDLNNIDIQLKNGLNTKEILGW